MSIMKNKEDKIINMRIYSDDLFQVFGWLSLLTKGVELPSNLGQEIVLEAVKRMVDLNIKNKEFLDAVKKG